MESSMELPQKIKNRTTIWSSNPTSGYLSKRIENRVSKRWLHTRDHGSTIYNSQEVKAPQMYSDRWTDTQNVVYTYNGILFSLKKEILSHATTWMKLEDIMLSEISQWQKDKCCIFHLYEESKIGKFIETENRLLVTRA